MPGGNGQNWEVTLGEFAVFSRLETLMVDVAPKVDAAWTLMLSPKLTGISTDGQNSACNPHPAHLTLSMFSQS